jgi:DNA-binding FadR family transcriptional regulator
MSGPLGAKRLGRIHGRLAHDLGVAIVGGRYLPGERLPGEVAFAGELAVSRTAYREAVRMLAAKGLVESRPKAGTVVRPRRQWALLDPDVLAWMFEGEPDPALVRDLFELRRLVEPAAAALAAERRDEDTLAQMAQHLEAMAKHGLASPEGRDADQRFHDAILQATGNLALAALSSSITAAVSLTTLFKQRRRALPRDPLPDHQALYAAIAASDAEGARKAMTMLVELAFSDMAQI